MRKLELEEVVKKKKPIWKNRTFWIIGIILALFAAYKIGSSTSVLEDIGENYYSNALEAFHELNVTFEDGEFPSDEVVESISNNVRAIESDPSSYTDKEIYISEQFTKMVVGIGSLHNFGGGQGFEEQIPETRANLAEVLEVDKDY